MADAKAPERIWAWDDKTPTERDKGWSACDAGTGSTEYVRKDLHDALAKERDGLATEVERLTAERDHALAQAAAAAMEMRDRAANSVEGWSLYTVEGDPFEALAAEEIRNLPIDPDAQQALNQLLAKAREDAIREAAHLIECDGDALGGKSGAAKAILALLNDGGRDE